MRVRRIRMAFPMVVCSRRLQLLATAGLAFLVPTQRQGHLQQVQTHFEVLPVAICRVELRSTTRVY